MLLIQYIRGIFFIKVWNYFIAKIIFISQKYFLRLFKMAANQSAPGLNRGLSSNIWCLRSPNYEKFTEECVKHME